MTNDDKKISSLYQQGKNRQPPEHLDNIIQKAAHDAVAAAQDSKGVKAKSPFSGGWPVMASIAALILITVILVPVLEQETAPAIVDMADDETLKKSKTAEQKLRSQPKSGQPQLERSSTQKITSSFKQSYQSAPVTYMDAIEKPNNAQESAETLEVMTMFATPSVRTDKNVVRKDGTMKVLTDAEPHHQKTKILATELPSFKITAERWLEKIRLHIERNELILAKEELNKFKKKYPDEKIDQAILDGLDL